MNCETSTKIICVLMYSCVVLIVPPIPNLYTFIIDCLAYTVTIAASVFVIYFLNTRPSSQKNILNKILILTVAAIILKCTRDILVSFIACFLTSELAEFIDTNPRMVYLLAIRYYIILKLGMAVWLSAGRLLLFTNPVLFHRLNPTRGAMVAVLITFSIGFIDFIYMSVVYGDNLKNSKIWLNFMTDTGITNRRVDNQTSKRNVTIEEEESSNLCYQVPTIQLLLVCAILMEVSRIVYLTLKEYKKKNAKVGPIPSISMKKLPLPGIHDLNVAISTVELRENKHSSSVNNSNFQAQIQDPRRAPGRRLTSKQRSKSLPRMYGFYKAKKKQKMKIRQPSFFSSLAGS